MHDSKIGDLFIFVDAIKFHGAPDGADDSTWYGEISPRLSLGKMLGKDLSFKLFKDVLVAGTYERGEDADVAEAALVGVGFDLDVGKSGFRYAQLNVYGRSELTEGTRDGFRDVQVTMVAARPFTVGKAQFLADGYFDWVLGLGSENLELSPQSAGFGRPRQPLGHARQVVRGCRTGLLVEQVPDPQIHPRSTRTSLPSA